ncbi:hypothetical protein ASE95_07800 [Sphingomonas sp. Leaf231]|uniref:hypothetical protein n=1 Tax=Sphingomonas sp. Leaf231 TaxID=1736301 RepID=UPI0006F4A378|nr:hypothetical protein [Sphingomonas sp. Leaf231]KQN92591.1 hypothetical protein ASE95_07800 [Sphingomonas sp. Leaf231]
MLGGWALAALVLLAAGWDAIVTRRFADADDAMRLLEVRDWLAGQGWFDVAQHRLNRGDFPMHWSRLVDLPLAATMLLLQPMLAATMAEHVALVVVPLLTLLTVMALAASIARRMGGDALVLPTLLMIGLAIPVTFQFAPMRIDHHGWQTVMALAAVRALLASPTGRSGAASGAALALLLTISLEGLPIAAAIGAVAGLGWVVRPARGVQLRALLSTLAGVALALHAATRGPGFWLAACDAMAPAWLGALVAAAIVLALAAGVERHGAGARLVALGVAGAAAAATLVSIAPDCIAGPFGSLPPLVYRIWYLSVPEGRPWWEQELAAASSLIALPLAGIFGGVLGWRSARGAARERWAMLLVLVTTGLAIAILVTRAGATANALAAPAAAVWLTALLTRARRVVRTAPRVGATIMVLLLAAPGTLAGAVVLALTPAKSVRAEQNRRPSCATALDMRALGVLRPGIVFAPIDVTPALLVDTPHRAIAGGYHRGATAIGRVLTGFIAAPDQARGVILASGADYLAVCPGMPEMSTYRTIAPGGLWARLERGERIDWLRPLPVRGPVLAWRVIHPLPEVRSAP